MIIELTIINPEIAKVVNNPDSEIHPKCMWHSRDKSYKSDIMDEDMKSSPVGHTLDRIKIDDFQSGTKKGVQDLIDFLENAKKSLKN